MSVSASFNTHSLQTFDGTHGILLADIDHSSAPDINLNIMGLAKQSQSTVTTALKQQKTITLSGKIIGSSLTDCSTLIKTFKGYLVGKEQTLLVSDGSGDINYICTSSKTTIDRPGYLNWANFSAEFVCSQPYGTDVSATTVLNGTGRTLASYSDAITVGGSSEWQTPIITITVSALTGGTNKSITVGNALTGQACVITRTWTAADVLVIDTSSLIAPVTVNGTQVPFTGALPTFNPSTYVSGQTITYADTLTTRTMVELITNSNRWD